MGSERMLQSCLYLVTVGLVAFPASAQKRVFYHAERIPHTANYDANDINDRGQIVGTRTELNNMAFLWDPVSGTQILGELKGGDRGSNAEAVNNLGHVVGVSSSSHGTEAFFWSPERGMIGLGDLPGGRFYSWAYAINDRDQVVGISEGTREGQTAQLGFIWDADRGMRALPDLPGGGFNTSPKGINNRGEVTGWSHSKYSASEIFLWDEVNGIRDLEPVPFNGSRVAMGLGINNRGWIACQGAWWNDVIQPLVWDPEEGYRLLGYLPGRRPWAFATEINDAGRVVGWGQRDFDELEYFTFVWDPVFGGIRDLEDVLDASTDPRDRDFEPYAHINNRGAIVVRSSGRIAVLTPFVLGDMNCNDQVDPLDIDPFLLALFDAKAYGDAFPHCPPAQWPGDANQDATFDAGDIEAFIGLLLSD